MWLVEWFVCSQGKLLVWRQGRQFMAFFLFLWLLVGLSDLVSELEEMLDQALKDQKEAEVSAQEAFTKLKFVDTQEQVEADVNEVEEGDDSNQQDPLTPAYGDGAHAEKLADIRHNIDMKKGSRGRARARARPPSMSLSQGFLSVGRRAVSHTVRVVGHPLTTSKVPGQIMTGTLHGGEPVVRAL